MCVLSKLIEKFPTKIQDGRHEIQFFDISTSDSGHYDVMQRVLQNPTNPTEQFNIFLIVFRATNFKTNFTFIYLEYVCLYVN